MRATLLGALAPILWATVPLCAIITKTLPPYQVVAMTFCISAFIMILNWRRQGKSVAAQLMLPKKIWALGIFGLFGFYLFHFVALRQAPGVEAILIINLWPLFMVLLTSLFERRPLRWWHMVGIVAGFGGIVMISAAHGFQFEPQYWRGYLAALACALIWSCYAALSRKLRDEIPSHAISCFCISNALLLSLVHVVAEPSLPVDTHQGVIILYMGIVPMCLAYFLWDNGIRNGDVRVLGGLSYIGPIVGSALLIAFGYAPLDISLVLSALLILGGAFFSSWMTFSRQD